MKRLAILAYTLVAIAAAGSFLWSYPARHPRVPTDLNLSAEQISTIGWQPNYDPIVGVTAFAIGIVGFFGIAGLDRVGKEPPKFQGERLRTSLACALIFTYLFIATFTTFVGNSQTVGPVTEKFVESFSSVISITIAFYFGASAVTQIFGKDPGAQPDDKGDSK